MSLFVSALGGAGDAMERMGLQNQKTFADEDMTSLQSELATQKAETLAQFEANLKVQTADTLRTQQQQRISDAAQPLVQQALDTKYANATPADPSTWTPEQQAAVDQSKQLDQQALLQDPKIRTQAAIDTGDISPTDAARMASQSEITQMKIQNIMDRAADKNATMKEIADARADAMKYGYELRLQAAQERAANGKIDTATGRMLITSEDANIRASTTQMGMLNTQLQNVSPTKDGKPNPAYTSIQDQIKTLQQDIADSKARKESYFKDYGLLPQGEPKPDAKPDNKPETKPAASAVPTLPPGSRQVGTSGGKPVYETPDGKRFIAQ
jgi:hypothetical protein